MRSEQQVPVIPYTDLHRYIDASNMPESLVESLMWFADGFREGKGGMGLASGVAYFYYPLDLGDQLALSHFHNVEAVWIAVDLEAFLNGGED